MLKSLIFIVVLGVAVGAGNFKQGPMKTQCQMHREREQKSNAPFQRLIPECDNNGDYKALQCFKDSKFCTCWDKEGTPVTQPSNKLKACDCLLQKNAGQMKHVIGNYIPQCADDGLFTKRQCSSSTGFCWCVNPQDGVQMGKAARGLKCD